MWHGFACAKVEQSDEKLVVASARAAKWWVGELKGQELANTAWAFATGKQQEELANTAWAFTTVKQPEGGGAAGE